MARVGLTRSDRSYEAVRSALQLVRGDVRIPRGVPVLIKPNLVSGAVELSATPVEAVRATMDFLVELGVERFVVGETTAEGPGGTMGAFERYGYLSLKKSYDVELRDLNQDEFVTFEALDGGLAPASIRLAKSYLDSYVVSVARMKTHDTVVVTLAIKNIVLGSIPNPDRHDFSHDPRSINLSMTRLHQAIPANLAVIDGVVGMEGNGPTNGTPVSSGIALAGTDALAVDLVGTELMGFDPRTVGYLWYLSQLSDLSRDRVEVLGEDRSRCITRYRAHDTLAHQLSWWVEEWRDYLSGSYLETALHQCAGRRGRRGQRPWTRRITRQERKD